MNIYINQTKLMLYTMSKSYVPRTLTEFLGESNSIPLKRKYGERPAITAGTNAPLRNQVLSFVAENQSVAKRDLKQFIIGLKEGGSTPAAATMFITRNAKYFISENKNGITYFKLSNLGKRLVNQFIPQEISESENPLNRRFKLNESLGFNTVDEADENEEPDEDDGAAEEIEFNDDELDDDDLENEDKTDSGENFEYEEDDEKIVLTYYKNNKDGDLIPGENPDRKFDFRDKGRPGITDADDSVKDDEEVSESVKTRMFEIINDLKSQSLNEAESDEADELSDKDLDKDEEPVEGEEDLNLDTDVEQQPEELEKVEITEFIITVDDVDSAIEELSQLGVNAERVPVEQPEVEVPADTTEEPAPEGEIDNLNLAPEDPAATTESLKAFFKANYLNEAEEPSDELGLGDQGEEATELNQPATEPTAPEETVAPTEEFDEHKIKVPAENWDALKGWLEEKGVDVKEMFGGDIETEEYETPDEAEAANTTPEVSDDEIDFTGIADKDATKVKDEETEKE